MALWKGRRIGPLVAEELPADPRVGDRRGSRSEKTDPVGRVIAADALRTASRLRPRLGWRSAPAPAVVTTIAQRSKAGPPSALTIEPGPAPATDNDLLQLARALDDIEKGRSPTATQSASNPQAPPTQTPGAELPGYPRKRVVPLQRSLPGRILTGLKGESARDALLALRAEVVKAVVGQDG